MSIEAMKQALEALEAARHGYIKPWVDEAIAALRTAIKQALAAPVQEPVGEVGTMPGTTAFTMACFKAEDVPVGTKLYTTPPAAQPAPVQKPYGYVSIGDDPFFQKETPDIGRWETVYTTPPAAQQPWVGLTDEEISELWAVSRAALPRYATYASLVEAKLRSKNT